MTRDEHLADPSVLKAIAHVRITVTHAPGPANGLGLTGISFGLLYQGKLVVEAPEDDEPMRVYVWDSLVVSYN